MNSMNNNNNINSSSMSSSMSSDAKNYYEILEISYNSSPEEIYEGYLRAKNTYSGDGLALYSILTKDECDEMLELIEAAYSILSVPHKRKEYDTIRGIGVPKSSSMQNASKNNGNAFHSSSSAYDQNSNGDQAVDDYALMANLAYERSQSKSQSYSQSQSQPYSQSQSQSQSSYLRSQEYGRQSNNKNSNNGGASGVAGNRDSINDNKNSSSGNSSNHYRFVNSNRSDVEREKDIGMSTGMGSGNAQAQAAQSPRSNTYTIASNNDKDFQIHRNEMDISRLTAQKRFALEYEANAEFEQRIESTTEFTGSFLKEIREYKNVTLEKMCDLTKISRTYLRQIEEGEYAKLPALSYLRGFVYQYAKCLRLNPDMVANSYIEYVKSLQKIKKK
ncbi:MAG: helix-turn-helix domain-containing protein [Oligoflexia bacterium]|nr:helix-turn-helix domain-containing protein [Oligoflexia bacterium]